MEASPNIPAAFEPILARIELLALDVDGVMTDGRVVYANHPTQAAPLEIQAFDVQDGLSLKWLKEAGVRVAWISGRGSQATRYRGLELGVDEICLQIKDKRAELARLQALWKIEPARTAAMGDDLPDLGLRRAAGLFVAPSNARAEVRERADFVTCRAGGAGAVRELAEALLRAKQRWHEIVDAALR